MIVTLESSVFAHQDERGWMRMCVEFWDEILLRGEECETPRKPNFLEKWQNGNFGQNSKFF